MSHSIEHLQEKANRINQKIQEVEAPPEMTREEFLQHQKDYLQTLIEEQDQN